MNDIQEEQIINWFEEHLDKDCKIFVNLFCHLRAAKILKWENFPFELSIINDDEEIENFDSMENIINEIEYFVYEGCIEDLGVIEKFIQENS